MALLKELTLYSTGVALKSRERRVLFILDYLTENCPNSLLGKRNFWQTPNTGSRADETANSAVPPLSSSSVGPNLELARRVARASGLPALLSGGVRELADLEAARAVPEIAGAIVGRALYEGAFSVEEALSACR